MFTAQKNKEKMAEIYGKIYRVDSTLELPVCPKHYFEVIDGVVYVDRDGEAELFFLGLKRYQPFVSSFVDFTQASVCLFVDAKVELHRCVARCIQYGNLSEVIKSQDDIDTLKLINASAKIVSQLSAESVVSIALQRCDVFCKPDYEEF